MTAVDTSLYLRRVLILDAAVSGATGLLMSAGASVLEPLLGVPGSLLRMAGLALLPFAVGLLLIARQRPVGKASVLTVIAANVVWVAASVALVAAPLAPLTSLGYAVVVAQALAVLGFAELQWIGLRRAARPALA